MGGTGRWVQLQQSMLQGGTIAIDGPLAVVSAIASATPSNNDGPLDLLAIALARIAVGRTADAEEPLSQASKQEPMLTANPDYMLAELAVELDKQDFEAANATAGRLKSTVPIYGPTSDLALEIGLVKAGRENEARQRLRQILEYPSADEAFAGQLLYIKTMAAVQLGLLELQLGQLDAAAETLAEAHKFYDDPGSSKSVVVHTLLAFAWGEQKQGEGDLDSAIKFMNEAATAVESVPQPQTQAAIWQRYAEPGSRQPR
jgi:tetratricopeptide (TPR) repeat protein